MRWVDDAREVAGRQWMGVDRAREEWQSLEEAYVAHWINSG